MERGKATVEQKAAAKARRERMTGLARRISKMGEAERDALARSCSVVTIEGHGLSMHNQCMLALQIPSATVVGGFRQWKRAGRLVRKGEHGGAIWVPLGKRTNGVVEGDVEHFALVTVFDVSQTQEATSPVAA